MKSSRMQLYFACSCILGLLLVISQYNQASKAGNILLSTDTSTTDAIGQTDDLIQRAADLERQQKQKVALAAIKLEREEQKEAEIEKEAAKMRQEAASKSNKAKSQFEALKHQIILEAAKKLEKAQEQEKLAEQAPLAAAAAAPADKAPAAAAAPVAAAAATPARAPAVSNSAKVSDDQIVALERELARAKKAAAVAERRMTQNLADGTPDETRMFREGHVKGQLGIGAISKWVPEDHPPSHADCKLHDIDCDELWPWGKAPPDFKGPPRRDGPLGDNLVGLFGQDDVVVPTEDSGLVGKAQPYEDKFDHWPEDSKKNKDLLYGLGRKVLSQKYTGAGDVYVPLDTAKKLSAGEFGESGASLGPGGGLADMVFGSWHMGFNKPHAHAMDQSVNMFDQPYRQHMAVVDGKGHQVYNLPKADLGKTLGDDDEEA